MAHYFDQRDQAGSALIPLSDEDEDFLDALDGLFGG